MFVPDFILKAELFVFNNVNNVFLFARWACESQMDLPWQLPQDCRRLGLGAVQKQLLRLQSAQCESGAGRSPVL